MIVATEELPKGENLILSASFEKEGNEPTCAKGTLTLYHHDRKVGEGAIKTQLGAFAIAGAPLFVGRHGGEAVTDDYPGEPPYTFTGGTIRQVTVNVSGEPYIDLERHAEMLLRSQ
jgi:arylsulfatase